MYAFGKDGRLGHFNGQGGIPESSAKAWVSMMLREDVPPQIGLLGVFTRRVERAASAYYIEIPKGTTCPEVQTDPCAVYARALAAGVKLLTRWQTPEPPSTPKLAMQQRKTRTTVKRRKRPFSFIAPGPVSENFCAVLLKQGRWTEARAGCDPAARFTACLDVFDVDGRLGFRTCNGGLDVFGVIRFFETAPGVGLGREVRSVTVE